jgi:DNA processing protein
MDELLYRIALTMVKDIGPIIGRNLIGYCGSAENVFKTKSSQLIKIPGVGEATARKLKEANLMERAEAEVQFTKKNKIKVLFFKDEDYPNRLKNFNESPLILYYKGNQNLNHSRVVSIVGTRRPTESGRAFCNQLVQDLSSYNVLLTSGLAYGIDVTAHKMCLKKDIPTVGVLGHGLDTLYPASHKKVSEQMINQGGLLSEFHSSSKFEKENFPLRNRIIAGMSDAVIVVESKEKGGSMITAEFANKYNKDVFAVPGRFNDIYSKGCNLLIKSHKALVIESIKDLLHIMRWEEMDSQKNIQGQLFIDLSPEEKTLYEILQSQEKPGIDMLSYKTQMPSSELANVLLNLEFKGLIRSLPGKRYMII